MEDDPNYKYFFAALKWFVPDNNKRDGSQKKLRFESGISQPMLSQIFSGSRNASFRTQELIAKALGYTRQSFIEIGISIFENGKPPVQTVNVNHNHPIIIQTNSEPDKEFMAGIIDRYQAIPLYESGRLAAGARGCEFDPHETPASMVVVYKPELQGCSRHTLAALKVGGNSMEPTIYKGAIVVVDLDDKEFADGRGRWFKPNRAYQLKQGVATKVVAPFVFLLATY